MPHNPYQHDLTFASSRKEENEATAFTDEHPLSPSENQNFLDPLSKFLAQVSQRPEAIAAVFGNEHLTYQELNLRANQYGHWLQLKGIGPEDIVGVCLERSLTLVLSILGIFKAGGCLLPLEPSYPRHRLKYMVEDCQPKLVLTQESYLEIFQHYSSNLIKCASLEEEVRQQSHENVTTHLGAGNLSVVFYTSGSTGNPKGVMEIHRKSVQSCDSAQKPDSNETKSLQVVSTDRMLVKCPMSFAPFLWELMQPLYAGGAAILAKFGGEQDFSYLIQLLINESITIGHFVPSSLRILLDQPDIESCIALTSVCCSGENLPNIIREKFFSRLNADMFLTYAATEAPGATSVHLHKDNFTKPLKLVQQKTSTIFVLDHMGYPVLIEKQGELHVEASGRIRGYFNQPDLTAEKFIPNPFSSSPGKRLYKTGDLAKILPNGNFQVIGRKDQQVKLRGYRIELGEIEAALTQHPLVKDAVVLCREDRKDDKQLVAYVTENSGPLNIADLRTSLQKHLPEYMLPSIFVVLKTLPLTPNGKVDRQALPVPDQTHRGKPETFVAPETPTEVLLADLWQDLLQVKKVGRFDHFFELGGHSLLATQLIVQLFNQHDIDLSLRSLFDHPKLMDLAQVVTEQLLQEMENSAGSELGHS